MRRVSRPMLTSQRTRRWSSGGGREFLLFERCRAPVGVRPYARDNTVADGPPQQPRNTRASRRMRVGRARRASPSAATLREAAMARPRLPPPTSCHQSGPMAWTQGSPHLRLSRPFFWRPQLQMRPLQLSCANGEGRRHASASASALSPSSHLAPHWVVSTLKRRRAAKSAQGPSRSLPAARLGDRRRSRHAPEPPLHAQYVRRA